MSRSYGQYCGLARALDVVGDRWNLLIVRQLLIAPARYRELVEGLPGVATNLLADRLRDLETAGVIERRLAEKGNAVLYALTPWGAELREPIDGLIRWSTPLMVSGPGGDHFRAEWLVVPLRALLVGRAAPHRSSTVGIAVDVCHATDTPAGEQKQIGPVKCGGGPVLFRGPNINPRVFDLLEATATANDIPVQVRGAPRATARLTGA